MDSESNEQPMIHIAMLGRFEISVGDASITEQINHSKKISNLLAYLIIHMDKSVPYMELFDLFWPNNESENPVNALKTMLYRIRIIMRECKIPCYKELITSKRGAYRWNTHLPQFIDIFRFDDLCNKALSSEDSEDDKIAMLEEATELYKGDLLPKCSMEEWVVPISTYYHSRYVDCVHALSELYQKQKRFAETSALCKKALAIEKFDEQIHYDLIYSLSEQSLNREAATQYEFVTDLFYTNLGIKTSKKLRELYYHIMDTENTMETDLDVIKTDLMECGKVEGAFFCEYELFKQIYRLESRIASRTGVSVFVGLLTILNAANEQLPLKQINIAMEQLLETVNKTLRKGDVLSRYSSAQYIIMLPTATYENGLMVMKRIVSSFKREHPKSPVMLHYKIQPLDPIGMKPE